MVLPWGLIDTTFIGISSNSVGEMVYIVIVYDALGSISVGALVNSTIAP